eukprot:11207479-Alexandrium_andersonii.AAC.1
MVNFGISAFEEFGHSDVRRLQIASRSEVGKKEGEMGREGVHCLRCRMRLFGFAVESLLTAQVAAKLEESLQAVFARESV